MNLAILALTLLLINAGSSLDLERFERICQTPRPSDQECKHGGLRSRLNLGPPQMKRKQFLNRRPDVIHTSSNISAYATFLAFSHLIPNAKQEGLKDGAEERRREYLSQISTRPPSFLAYIEFFDVDVKSGGGRRQPRRRKRRRRGKKIRTGHCTGSLVNSQYVLTAGHCLCKNARISGPPDLPCSQDSSGSYHIAYEPEQNILLWIGLDSSALEMRYTNFDSILEAKYHAIAVRLHPKFRQLSLTNGIHHWDDHDIGLIKLDRPTCIGDLIRPINLPIGWRGEIVNDGDIPSREQHVFEYDVSHTSDEERYGILKSIGKLKVKEAFVTGYGIPHETGKCRTWDGRSPLQKCKFPFKVLLPKGSDRRCEVYSRTFDKCIDVVRSGIFPPDYYQSACIEFDNAWPKAPDGTLEKFNSVGSSTLHNILRLPAEPGLLRPDMFANAASLYQVVDFTKNCTTECANVDVLQASEPFAIAKNGWCATCDPEAMLGEPNYCGDDYATKEHDRERFESEMAIAEPGKNWGFCSDECSYKDDPLAVPPTYAGLGLMSYLSREECIRKLGEDNINTEFEFCGGNVVTDQRRRFVVNGHTGHAEEIEPLIRWQNLTYIGGFNVGTTICGGDSGGPVFLPIVVEWEDFGINEEELLHLSTHNRTKSDKTEAEIMANIMRDPILIGVTRRSLGCGIRDQPPIFGKIWKYLDWITDTIKDAAASTQECKAERFDPIKMSIAELVKSKGPGIITDREQHDAIYQSANEIIDKVNKHITLEDLKLASKKNFDLDIDAVFDIV